MLAWLGVDALLATDSLVLRPLRASTPHVGAALRGVLIIAVVGYGLVLLARWLDPGQPGPARADHPAGLTEAETLRATVAQLPPERDESPATLAVHVGTSLVEVFWGGPSPPPPEPWRSPATGWVWEADRDQLVGSTGLDRRRWARLVPVGATTTGTLWLNLGAFGVIALVGDAGATRRQAAAVVRALRRRAESGAVELVAPDDFPATADDRADQAAIERALAALWRRCARRRAALAEQGRFHRRAAGPEPLVVVTPAAPGLGPLLARARVDPAATVIVIGEHDGADLHLRCGTGTVTLPFLGDVVLRADEPTPPAPPIAIAAEPPERLSTGDGDPGTATPDDTVDETRVTSPDAVEVRVLGPVEVQGAAGALTGKSLELVAYLACHPDGAPDEQIRAALWPEGPPASATWAQRVSATRRALGRDADGSHRLLRFRQHVGRLSPTVSTDARRLEETLARCRDTPAPACVEQLESHLEAIRGRPFDMPRGYRWAHDEGHVRRAEQIVVDAAHFLADRRLEAGDWERAMAVSERGLRTCPSDDVLAGDRARAARMSGLSTGELATRALREALRDLDPELGFTGPPPDLRASRVTADGS